nr:protein FAM32A isoform X1 [Anolis sagrei ordinatus]
MSEYEFAQRGPLRLKGAAAEKQRKKRKRKKADEAGKEEEGGAMVEKGVSSKKPDEEEKEEKRALDKRTPAQLAYEKIQEKRQIERILKKASKTHKQRVETINSPAACEVRSVIRFLSARNLPAAEIHRQICEVYGDTVMSESKVRKWVRQFKDGRDNVHDEDRSGRPSLITDDLVASVEARIRENRRFTITGLSNEFPDVSRSVLYNIVSGHLKFRKLCSRWVP